MITIKFHKADSYEINSIVRRISLSLSSLILKDESEINPLLTELDLSIEYGPLSITSICAKDILLHCRYEQQEYNLIWAEPIPDMELNFVAFIKTEDSIKKLILSNKLTITVTT